MTDIIEIRKYLHANPELSGLENGTRDFIVNHLKALGIKNIKKNDGDPSFLMEIKGAQPGKTVLFRCELDALPINETNSFPHRSKHHNISHKCGHDGHMAILMGLAEKMTVDPPQKGTVLLLFQSAEETGEGAENVINSGLLEPHYIDFAFALHNIPGVKLGSIICKTGNFTPAVESLTITLHGKTSHAGEPENGINPASTIANLIHYFNGLHRPDKDLDSYFVSTPIHIHMGEKAFGVSAGEGELSYTFRTHGNSKLERLKKDIEIQIQTIVKKSKGLEVKTKWLQPFKANINDDTACEIIKKASEVNKYPFIDKENPFDWGEDFGLFTTQYKGAMFGLGAGEQCPALHNPDYDFPDELLEKGINMFHEISKQILK